MSSPETFDTALRHCVAAALGEAYELGAELGRGGQPTRRRVTAAAPPAMTAPASSKLSSTDASGTRLRNIIPCRRSCSQRAVHCSIGMPVAATKALSGGSAEGQN